MTLPRLHVTLLSVEWSLIACPRPASYKFSLWLWLYMYCDRTTKYDEYWRGVLVDRSAGAIYVLCSYVISEGRSVGGVTFPARSRVKRVYLFSPCFMPEKWLHPGIQNISLQVWPSLSLIAPSLDMSFFLVSILSALLEPLVTTDSEIEYSGKTS